MFGKLAKKLAREQGYPGGCGCREPIRHRDCSYCGVTALEPGSVCAVCRAQGIDGTVIRSTLPYKCLRHRQGK